MSGNYPPGVTGNEPEITGEWPVDPHEPYWAGEACYNDADGYAVFFGNSEDEWFDGFETLDEAETFAKMLNDSWGWRKHDLTEHEWCRICGDYFGEDPLGDY